MRRNPSPAARSSSARRVVYGQRLIVAEGAGPFRLEHLRGAVDRVAAEHHALAVAGRDLKADLAGRVAGQGENPPRRTRSRRRLHSGDQAALDHRQDAVLEAAVIGLGLGRGLAWRDDRFRSGS